MEYFAFEGGVRTDQQPGDIPISEADYAAAIEGILSGKTVSVADGFSVVDIPGERHWASVETGLYLGLSVEQPEGSIEVPSSPDDARQVFDDGAWQPLPIETIRADLADYARQVSWQTRTAGTLINGVPIALDDGAIALINGLYVSASRDANKVFSFDTSAGSIELTSEQAIALSVAVSDWVQLTFDRRAAVLTAITAGQVTTTAEIDAAFIDVTDGWTA
jgi:hypothetical protein